MFGLSSWVFSICSQLTLDWIWIMWVCRQCDVLNTHTLLDFYLTEIIKINISSHIYLCICLIIDFFTFVYLMCIHTGQHRIQSRSNLRQARISLTERFSRIQGQVCTRTRSSGTGPILHLLSPYLPVHHHHSISCFCAPLYTTITPSPVSVLICIPLPLPSPVSVPSCTPPSFSDRQWAENLLGCISC